MDRMARGQITKRTTQAIVLPLALHVEAPTTPAPYFVGVSANIWSITARKPVQRTRVRVYTTLNVACSAGDQGSRWACTPTTAPRFGGQSRKHFPTIRYLHLRGRGLHWDGKRLVRAWLRRSRQTATIKIGPYGLLTHPFADQKPSPKEMLRLAIAQVPSRNQAVVALSS